MTDGREQAPAAPAAAAYDVVAVQRHTVRTLVGVQAVGAIGITIGTATASLLVRDLSGSATLAGLAQTFQVLGTAVAAYGLARLMALRGRRAGLGAGYAVGTAGAVLAVVAGVLASTTVLLLGALLLGGTTAANQAARYAATDLAPTRTRARALAVVVWGTTLGAVAGPNLTGPASAVVSRLGLPALTGPFAFGALGMGAAGVLVTVLLRPDPLLVARATAEERPVVPAGTSWSRVVAVVRARPLVGAAMAALALAHTAMVAVMVMTPLHMDSGGATLQVIGVVISVHVLGMFALSPVFGWLADTVGRGPVVLAGGVVLLGSLVLSGAAPVGSSWQIFAGLFLLGVGWSMVTTAGATLVADATPLEVRTDVQGASDALMALVAAAGGAVAGPVVAGWGYAGLAVVAAVLSAGVVAAGGYASATRRPDR